jgi:hypothetical protein
MQWSHQFPGQEEILLTSQGIFTPFRVWFMAVISTLRSTVPDTVTRHENLFKEHTVNIFYFQFCRLEVALIHKLNVGK